MSIIALSPYELFDITNQFPPLPSRDKMCWAIARSDAAKIGLSDMRTFYRLERKQHLYKYEKKDDIERLYAGLTPRYKVKS